MTTRRHFVLYAIPAAFAIAAVPEAGAAPAKLKESDQIAKSLGYHLDATKVDRSKWQTYQPGHKCANCQFFQGKPGDTWAVCPVVGGKLVNHNGWCSAWAKKA